VSDLPSGTVTFLFTDVEGSTRLLKQLGDRYAEVLATHRDLLRAAVEESGGRPIDTQGDSFFAAFHRAKDAVTAAVTAQRTLAAQSWPDGAELRVRMGIHTGEPVVGSDSYVGLGVHRAARICAAGHGAQILVSQTTRELLRDDPSPETGLRDLGEQLLKDLDHPERIYQVVAEGLPDDFPALKTAVARPARAGPAVTGWDFRILGPLEVWKDGESLQLGGRRPRSVLALLLLNADHVVSTDHLVDRLWGEEPPRTATTSLQNCISQLRKLLGADRLLTRPPGYVVRVEQDELDLRRFERLVAEANVAEPEERAQKLRDALALWRGAPLADFSFETFAQGEINRLEELRLNALEDRFDADLERGRHGEVVGELESLLAHHPLRERLRGQLMLALYRSGRQAEALQTYQEGRHALVEELGIDPSPELQALHAGILRQETRLQRTSSAPAGDDHSGDVVKALVEGRLVTVLGPGVEPRGLPNAIEHLAKTFGYPRQNGVAELPRVAQYVATMTGPGPLYDTLHELYSRTCEPGPVHRFVANMPARLRELGAPHQLVVTTGYDLVLEQALTDAGEEFDVVAYVATGRNRGRFWHLAPGERPRVIEIPNTYATELSLERRTVVLKLHGGVDRDTAREWESFVVTEDDYIDYLARDELANLIPVGLTAKLRRSHFLFLGYALRDWNMRVLLNRLWGEEKVGYRSWAVQPEAPALEIESWRRRDVDVFDIPLEQYVATLDRRLAEVRA
jgi:DNA-binding SARP family transcriptional activator/class 3 adenylate cyclase